MTDDTRFVLRLALALGKTLGELLGQLDDRELELWRRFDRIEPIGGRRADLQTGLTAAITRNATNDLMAAMGARGMRYWSPDELTPRYGPSTTAAQTEDDVRTIARADPFTDMQDD